MKTVFCKLARPGMQIPMPGARRLFSERGETVDAEAAFWRRLIDDGDVVIAKEDAEAPADPEPANPEPAKAKRKG